MDLALKRNTLLIVVFGMLLPELVHANAGVPMLAVAWPAQWLVLVPIVLLETEIIRRGINLPFKQLFWPTAKANFVSTLIGVPVAWLVMLTPLMVISFGHTLLPPEYNIPVWLQYLIFPFTAAWVSGSSIWQVYFAFVVLAIPFCLISIFLEKGVYWKAFPEIERKEINRVVVRANVWSYIAVTAGAVVVPLLVKA